MGHKNGRSPQTLSEAIHQLEKAATSKLGHEFDDIKQALDDLKPLLNNVKDSAIREAKAKAEEGWQTAEDMGKKVDAQVRENPWMSLGIVALIALVVGILLGRRD